MTKEKSKKPRRKKGAGRVFRRRLKRADGSVYFSKKYYLEHTVNGKKKTLCLDCETERDAKAKAAALLNPVKEAVTKEQIAVHIGEARKIISKSKVKIDDVWKLYLKNHSRPDSSEGTLKNYEGNWKRFKDWLESSYPGITSLGEVTDEIAVEYAGDLWDLGIAGKTFNNHIKALHLITRILAKKAGVDRNPWDKDNVTRKNEVKQSRKELTEDQVLNILDSFDSDKLKLMHKPEMKVMFHLGAWTGLRLIDCALMKWESIDLEKNLINCIPHKTRKTQKSITIPIHPLLHAEFEKALKWQTNEYVLPQVADRYFRNSHGVKKDAVKVFEKAGLKVTQETKKGAQRKRKANVYGFHSFRHSFVSFCAKAGVPLPVVQSIVGHGNPAITRHYIHIGRESSLKAINALPMASEKKDSAEEKLVKIIELMERKRKLTKIDRDILKILK